MTTITQVTQRFCGAKKRNRSIRCKPAVEKLDRRQDNSNSPGIIDHKFVLLAGAKAAVDSDCRPCLEEIVHELEGAGVAEDDIRRAVKRGQLTSAHAIGQAAESAYESGADGCEKQ